jgi:hypothetical protein
MNATRSRLLFGLVLFVSKFGSLVSACVLTEALAQLAPALAS